MRQMWCALWAGYNTLEDARAPIKEHIRRQQRIYCHKEQVLPHNRNIGSQAVCKLILTVRRRVQHSMQACRRW